MKITAAKIKAFNPCKSRFNNFVQQYPGFSGDVEDFLTLENICYQDKVWVALRLLSHRQGVYFALMCASSQLDAFEKNRPGDDRPRKALIAVEAWLNRPTEKNRQAAYAAAAYAVDAASGVFNASVSAAVDAAHGVSASSAVSAAFSASYAAVAAAPVFAAETQQQELHLLFLAEAFRARK